MKKLKLTKRTVIAVAVVTAAVLGGGFMAYGGALGGVFGGKEVKISKINAAALSKTNLRDTISLSGTIYSDTDQNVYSTLSYPVKEIYVKLGDRVKAGDVLAVLDVSELEFDIRQAENNYESALASATEEERSLSENRSSSSISAQSSLLSLQKAEASYKTLQSEFAQGSSSKLVTEKKTVDTTSQTLEKAKNDIEIKQRDFESNKLLFEAGAISQSELQTFETAYNNAVMELATAERQYNNAVSSYNAVKKTLESDMNTAKIEVESARLNYASAQNNLSGAQNKASSGGYSLEGQKISLEKLKTQMEDASIKAGIDGVITEIGAVVGASAKDILFVIEDDTDLYASISVKEYNLAKISTGQSAIITTDATERDVLRGNVSYIAPKATDAGESTTVEFATHVKLSEPDKRIKIGMNAFVNVITAEARDVYAVSVDSLVTGANGNSIYTVENGTVVEVPVTIGLETATSVEISGDLRDGMLVIINPSDTSPGSVIDESALNIMQTQGAGMRGGSGGMGGMSGTGAAGQQNIQMPVQQGAQQGTQQGMQRPAQQEGQMQGQRPAGGSAQ